MQNSRFKLKLKLKLKLKKNQNQNWNQTETMPKLKIAPEPYQNLVPSMVCKNQRIGGLVPVMVLSKNHIRTGTEQPYKCLRSLYRQYNKGFSQILAVSLIYYVQESKRCNISCCSGEWLDKNVIGWQSTMQGEEEVLHSKVYILQFVWFVIYPRKVNHITIPWAS